MGKRDAGAAAARHMSRPAQLPAAGGQAESVPAHQHRAEPARAGATWTRRRKRAVARVLAGLVMVSVPALIALLVLFG